MNNPPNADQAAESPIDEPAQNTGSLAGANTPAFSEQLLNLETEPPTAQGPAALQQVASAESVVLQSQSADVPAPQPSVAQVIVAPVAPAKTKWRLRKVTAVAIVAAIVVVGLAGGGAYAYTVYQKPENVLPHAISNVLSATQIRAKTTVTSSFSYDGDGIKISTPKLVFETGADLTPSMDGNAQLSVRYNNQDIVLKASALMASNGDVYYKVDNAKDTLKKVFGSELTLSAKAESIIDSIDGKWAKYTIADISKSSAKSGKTAQCVLDTYKKYKDDKKVTAELAEVYKQHQFLVPDGEPTKKDGNTGYPAKFDQAAFVEFEKSAEKTTVANELRECRGYGDIEDMADYDTAPSEPSKYDPKVSVTVWVASLTHELRAVDAKVVYSHGLDDKPFTIESQTEILEGKGVTTQAPANAMSSEEWLKQASLFYEEVIG